MDGSNAYFTETQRFRQPWLWLIIVAVDIMIIFGIVSEMQKTKSDARATLIFAAAIATVTILLFLILRLDTKITAEGINYRFFPFQFKFMSLNGKKSPVLVYAPTSRWLNMVDGALGMAFVKTEWPIMCPEVRDCNWNLRTEKKYCLALKDRKK